MTQLSDPSQLSIADLLTLRADYEAHRATRPAAELTPAHFTAFCPYASRFPFETWILPKQHSSHYENIPKPSVDDLGNVLRQVLAKLELALDSPPYNYIIHTAPFDHQELPHYHWHIEIIPRLTKVAGFEWGSGFYINPVPPEEAAAFLREVEVNLSPGERPILPRVLSEPV
jgi:UDPglucose--hexose-1-phosphate uridylyltransferase